MNTYRVDRVINRQVPCGMNSIRYIGDSFKVAKALFDKEPTGFDAWGQPNAAYGVVLSVWNPERNEYVVKCERGLS